MAAENKEKEKKAKPSKFISIISSMKINSDLILRSMRTYNSGTKPKKERDRRLLIFSYLIEIEIEN